jgi:hypothetical protein
MRFSLRGGVIGGVIAVSACFASPASGAMVFNFDSPAGDDGAETQGWIHTRGGPSVPVAGGRGASVGGGSLPGQEDGPHPNLVFSSPAFFLDGSGDLTFQLKGGEGKGDVPTTTFFGNLSEIPAGESTTDGFQYVALRRVSDGAYLLNAQRSVQDNTWEPGMFTQAQLAPLMQPGVGYQLDLIETRHGGWGHTEIDDVSIPGVPVPEPTSLAAATLAGLLLLRRRRAD